MNWPRFPRASWAALTGKPTTIGGFGITDGVTTTAMDAAIAVAVPARSVSNPTRALNTAVQINATRDTAVSYPVDISVSSLLLGNARGTVTLQYADNAGMSTNLVNVCSGTNSTSGVLSIINISAVTLAGIVPAGKYARILTVVDVGTASFNSRQGQEALL